MFALIETKGATHIAINIPHDGADKSLPALAAMLENNATFINKGWREMTIVKAGMTIQLSNTLHFEADEAGEIIIAAGEAAIDESFGVATPELFASNAKAMKKKNDELTSARNELAGVKEQLRQARDRIDELEAVEVE